MNEIYVPFGTQHNIENDDTVEILRHIGAKRVFVTPVVRIPFQKCEKRTELLNRMKSQIAFFKKTDLRQGRGVVRSVTAARSNTIPKNRRRVLCAESA